jgi:LacI family transcriptional regulator
MPVTLKDIAKKVGVSVTTVSRALNGYHDVGDAMRAQIIKVARELNYIPNEVARSLVKTESKAVAVIIPRMYQKHMVQPSLFEIFPGISETLSKFGYDLLVFSPQGNTSYYSFAEKYRTIGMIVIGSIDKDSAQITELRQSNLPCVLVETPVLGKKICYIETDNEEGELLAVDHLFTLGHRRIGFVNGPGNSYVAQERLKGYQKALKKKNIPYDGRLVAFSNYMADDGAQKALEIVKNNPDVTALTFANDMMAIGALRLFHQLGVKVPEDLSMVGFDDVEFAALAMPALTTIRQQKYQFGKYAAQVLLDMVEGGEGRRISLAPELIVRDSCRAIP